jgi:hypothetical protein
MPSIIEIEEPLKRQMQIKRSYLACGFFEPKNVPLTFSNNHQYQVVRFTSKDDFVTLEEDIKGEDIDGSPIIFNKLLTEFGVLFLPSKECEKILVSLELCPKI